MSDRPRPKTQADWFGEQALSAWQTGQSALEAGDPDKARRWFERARRFAPDDATIALSLAMVMLRQGDPAAEALFNEVTARHDLREAWLGLAAWRAQSGAWSAAAEALMHALSRHVLPDGDEMAPLADAIAREGGRPGWCGVRQNGRLHLVADSYDIVARLDGARLPNCLKTVPSAGAELALLRNGVHLLGSPIALARLRALDGFVEVTAAGLTGWAWHPANPAAEPHLLLRGRRAGEKLQWRANGGAQPTDQPLARPRRFDVPAHALTGWLGPVHVTGPDGVDLPGSPVELNAESATATALARSLAAAHPIEAGGTKRPLTTNAVSRLAVPADLIGPTARAPLVPTRKLAVVVPAYRDIALTLACLAAVQATMPAGTRVIVVDDATPEPELALRLDKLAASRQIRLLRHKVNRGFPAAANTGLRAAAALPGRPDIVLLNADALLTDGALDRLRAAVHTSGDIGTATPLSNDATILSFPDLAGNPLPHAAELRRIGRLAARANGDATVDIPTAIGFCMYIRRECLVEVGLFRETVFAQGYGEENDFCIRARHLGWRHVAATGVFVGHASGASFRVGALGAARRALITRNQTTLERLHPGYHALIAEHHATDPLAPARRRLDTARWAARRPRNPASTILVTHDGGGGVERVIRARCAELIRAGRQPIVLRPVRDPRASSIDARTYLPGLCEVCDGTARDTPNLRFALPTELPALARLLRPNRPDALEIHHLQGHDQAILDLANRLGILSEIYVHDYAWFCPRITLLGPQRQYCGEPTDPAVCEACIADAGRNDEQTLSVAGLRASSAEILGGARHVIVPSTDAAARIHRHFPAVIPSVRNLENDTNLPPARPVPVRPRRIAVVGAIGAEKGYDVLLACARDAATRRLDLEFIVIGHSIDDARLLATGRVFITGPYREAQAVQEIIDQAPDLAFLPAIWPETWCFTLGEAWQAGLRVAAFDIGAPAERIRRTGRGWLLPLGLPPAAVNTALLDLKDVP